MASLFCDVLFDGAKQWGGHGSLLDGPGSQPCWERPLTDTDGPCGAHSCPSHEDVNSNLKTNFTEEACM